ncbi:helix-turn-helix domain-containing protein [Vagococcus sp. DIV0080]|uniref:Helix-turn-helix domain-containing protein n=1 Tax=Candidatus Vagococcus giribetii TaxID=2230876 RepID=A0ABS3HPL5_9ENTE|nr:RodZ domain-containing protein [Vagococcus sp. DIV0080]MBO0475684.1 helix-turn-helix domain-containing protein [Vagococcus sp. DIV0080]
MENLERRSNTLETIGEKLQKARIDRGLTIGDLQKITKIQRRYLEAIEENDFDAMPSDYYKRTFIRQFAEAVGLNPRPLLRRLDGKPEETDLSNTMALSIPVKGSRKSKYNETNSKKSMIAAYLPVVLLVLVVLGIIGTIVWAIMIDSEKGPIVPTPNKTTIVDNSTTQSTVTSSAKEEKTTESSTPEKEKNKDKKEKKAKDNIALESDTGEAVLYKVSEWEKPMKVAFKGLDAAAWIGLENPQTQELFYQYTIQPGEELETFVPDDLDSFAIVVGAARNVSITINGEEIKFNEKTPVDGKKVITLEKGTLDTQSTGEER